MTQAAKAPAKTTTTTAGADTELRALLQRVRQIELRAKKTASAKAAGAWHSRFKGRGMAFSESRAYADGDDPRHVDWRATARTGGELFVKQFVEERELTLLLVVDVSGSMATGSRARLRSAVAAEACAVLALSAQKNQDKVGLVLFGDDVERLVRPQKGRGHVLRVVRDVLATKASSTSTAWTPALEAAGHLLRQRAIVVVVSDCQGPLPPERMLRSLAARHDVAIVEVRDPLDRDLPAVGLMSARDAESGRTVLVDTDSAKVRDAYRARFDAAAAARTALWKKSAVDHVVVELPASAGTAHGDDLLLPLLQFLRRRAKRSS